MEKLLVMVDVQEDFTRGALRNEEAIKALLIIHEIAEYANKNGMKVIYTRDTHGADYMSTQEGTNLPVPHCIFESEGWQICPEAIIENANEITAINKSRFGTFDWLFKDYGRGASEIWICGFCTDICVSANFQILKALYPETPIYIIEDACAGVTPELHDAAIKVMSSCQAKIVKWNDMKIE